MARKTDQSPTDAQLPRDRIDLRADPAWVARLERQAERAGITVTAYVKLHVSRALEKDEESDPQIKRARQ